MTDSAAERGEWHVEPAMGGAGTILEKGAGAGGSFGLVGTLEIREDAEWAVRTWNGRKGRRERVYRVVRARCDHRHGGGPMPEGHACDLCYSLTDRILSAVDGDR